MAIFGFKNRKRNDPRRQRSLVPVTNPSGPSPSHNLSLYHSADGNCHRGDSFKNSYEWNDLRQSPVQVTQGPRLETASPSRQKHLPNTTISPVDRRPHGPNLRSRDGTASKRGFQGLNTGLVLPQQVRGRTRKRTPVGVGRRKSVIQRTRADLYHADLLDDAHPERQDPQSDTSLNLRHFHLPFRPHDTKSAPSWTFDASQASGPTAHSTSYTYQARNVESRGFAKTPQNVSAFYPAELRTKKAPGNTLQATPRVGRRRSVMEHIMADPYHAIMFEDGGFDDQIGGSGSEEMEGIASSHERLALGARS
ncbi:predicted protein [Plenodomus lingam JN3]|uniref:Predicted protein n=2 Tax=Leptosphaeria maculans TaxID=5022 RepID=E4ZQB6_LEPMJ|nr:predicted protein [Plenodomus lingam JN3]CBX93591.1 predicted protein [Plenodomus lingam JN3]